MKVRAIFLWFDLFDWEFLLANFFLSHFWGGDCGNRLQDCGSQTFLVNADEFLSKFFVKNLVCLLDRVLILKFLEPDIKIWKHFGALLFKLE